MSTHKSENRSTNIFGSQMHLLQLRIVNLRLEIQNIDCRNSSDPSAIQKE